MPSRMIQKADDPFAPLVPDTSAMAPHSRASRRARLAWLPPVLVVLLVIALAGCCYFFIQYRHLKSDPSYEAHAAATRAVRELARVMVVPSDPNPVLATVSDKDKLKGQPFFSAAENGDQVIIFPASMKAVLYRPSLHKVIDIAPLAAGTGAQAAVTAMPEPDDEPSSAEASASEDASE